MNKNFWKGKRVLITGYEGFLGSNLTKRLLSYGARIFGLDIITFREETILTSSDLARIEVLKGNVSNYKLVKRVVEGNKIEFIFHLAAEAIVNRSLKNPLRTFSSNIEGTWNILEIARKNPEVKVVVASSDKAYGIKNRLPYSESDSLSGSHPYDVSKSCADLLSYTYFKTYSVPVCITRCGNIYGPGDFNFSRIVPDTIRSVLSGRKLLIRSDGKFTRDYIFVDDVVSAYLLLAEKMEELGLYGEAFNFSNEKPISVIELVKRIYAIAGKKPNYTILNEAKNEIPHQYLSSQKARKILKWKPEYDIADGLRRTIKWYSQFWRGLEK
ncbi:MAG: GDP-mannose 4,6-dehydratase [Candidatus Odinarchaeia archaeon]